MITNTDCPHQHHVCVLVLLDRYELASSSENENVQIYPDTSQLGEYLLVCPFCLHYPSSLSTNSIEHYADDRTRWCGKGGFADRKCTLDDTLDRWFDDRFPTLSIYHGGQDFLVLAEPLLERLKHKEKDVKVIKTTKLDGSQVGLPCNLMVTNVLKRRCSIAISTGPPKR